MRYKNLKIGIDIDEVITKTIDGFLQFYNTKFDKKVLFSDISCYEFWDILGVKREDLLNLFFDFYDHNLFENLSLIEGVIDAINNLSKKNEVFFITARPFKIKDKTQKFLSENFPNISFTLICSSDFFNKENNTGFKSKAEICQKLNIEVMVEDNKDYALDCAKKGIKSFLINKPWNQDCEDHENLIKVNHWNEIIEELNKK